MNKPTITLSGARGEEWERILGTRTFAILHPEYREEQLGGAPGDPIRTEPVVMLDVDALSRDQQDALIDHLARKFRSPREIVAADVLGRGVPMRLGADTRIDGICRPGLPSI